jgi:hypothetical protein
MSQHCDSRTGAVLDTARRVDVLPGIVRDDLERPADEGLLAARALAEAALGLQVMGAGPLPAGGGAPHRMTSGDGR